MTNHLLPTTLVGSYPQPDRLVHKDILIGSGPPRVRMRDVWRPAEELLEEAQDDATLVALYDKERAGIDIVSDGEVRRESYFNRFANALDGIDVDSPATVPGRSVIDILDCGVGMAQAGVAEPVGQTAVVPFGFLSVEQQSQPLGMIEFAGLRVRDTTAASRVSSRARG